MTRRICWRDGIELRAECGRDLARPEMVTRFTGDPLKVTCSDCARTQRYKLARIDKQRMGQFERRAAALPRKWWD